MQHVIACHFWNRFCCVICFSFGHARGLTVVCLSIHCFSLFSHSSYFMWVGCFYCHVLLRLILNLACFLAPISFQILSGIHCFWRWLLKQITFSLVSRKTFLTLLQDDSAFNSTRGDWKSSWMQFLNYTMNSSCFVLSCKGGVWDLIFLLSNFGLQSLLWDRN